MKFFRVLSEGQNPEVEIGAALTAGQHLGGPGHPGLGHRRVGGPAGGRRRSEPAHVAQGELAVAHEFLAGGRDAWRLAVDAASPGTDFTAEAHALGAATATVHRRLAEALGVAAESAPGKDIAPGVAQRVRQSWAEAGPAVGPYDDALDGLLRQLEGSNAGALQRIHGDLHLGQILQVPGAAGGARRWAILDFEGEPLRPIAERNFPDVPLRDVVGMLRSFDYAAGAAEREQAGVRCRNPGWTTAPRRSWPATAKSRPAPSTAARRCLWHCGWTRRCTKSSMSCGTGPEGWRPDWLWPFR